MRILVADIGGQTLHFPLQSLDPLQIREMAGVKDPIICRCDGVPR
jgi:hypothetical protein